jgi:para-nitrobenzyl esterase
MGTQHRADFSAGGDRTIRWRRRAGMGFLMSILLVFGVEMTDAMADSPTRIIETTSGPVQGVSNGVVNKFEGIRYANSTAGANRWTTPTAPPRSDTIFDATTPGSPCPQQVNQFSPPPPFSEDCLFLNVITPVASEGKLPVWIFIHGGALVNGTGAAFDPSVLVSTQNIIVVTINYRLGALGWLANPALDGNGIAGNYGLMDQQLAFTWVRDNIEHFGGNRLRVTIGGESAGGLSTLSNLASPTANGLFQAAIIESGAYMLFTVQPVAAQEALGVEFATAVGCTGTNTQIAACLRNAPVATLLASQGTIHTSNTSPTAGTTILPQGLADAFSSGGFNRVPVMQGTNLNEGTLFEPFAFDPTFNFVPGGPAQSLVDSGVLSFAQEVGLFFGLTDPAEIGTLVALYPPASFPNPDNNNKPSADEALGQILTDITFTCRGLDANQLLAGFVPVYAYEFADPDAPNLFQPLIGFSYGASHVAELQYLFDAKTLQGPADAAANAASPAPGAAVQPPPLTTGGQQLAAEMQAYWANFVRSHDPNGQDLAFWPVFGQTGSVQELVPGPAQPFPISNFSTAHNCGALTILGLIK